MKKSSLTFIRQALFFIALLTNNSAINARKGIKGINSCTSFKLKVYNLMRRGQGCEKRSIPFDFCPISFCHFSSVVFVKYLSFSMYSFEIKVKKSNLISSSMPCSQLILSSLNFGRATTKRGVWMGSQQSRQGLPTTDNNRQCIADMDLSKQHKWGKCAALKSSVNYQNTTIALLSKTVLTGFICRILLLWWLFPVPL